MRHTAFFISCNLLHGTSNVQQTPHDRGELIEGNHVRPVARRAVGIGMRLEEQAVGAHGHGRAGQRFDHRPIAAGGRAQAAGSCTLCVASNTTGTPRLAFAGWLRMSFTSRP